LRIAHEMADVVEEDLVENGKLTVGHRSHGRLMPMP
jgi:hypothetical protein